MGLYHTIVNYLKKYALIIAIVQAILWPIGIAVESHMNNNFTVVQPAEALIGQVVLQWHSNNEMLGYRSYDECIGYKDKHSKFLHTAVDCSIFDTEKKMIDDWAEIYEVDINEEMTKRHIAMMLYPQVGFGDKQYPSSVKQWLEENK